MCGILCTGEPRIIKNVSYGVGILVLGEQSGEARGAPLFHSLDVCV